MDDLVCLVTWAPGVTGVDPPQTPPADAPYTVGIESHRLGEDQYRRRVVDELVDAGRALARSESVPWLAYSFDGSSRTTLYIHPDDDALSETLRCAVDELAAEAAIPSTAPARARLGRRVAAAVAVAAAVVGGLVVVGATSGRHSDDAATGTAAALAKAVAVASAGGGQVLDVEHDPDDAEAWEVEVSAPDGLHKDVHLDRHFNVISAE